MLWLLWCIVHHLSWKSLGRIQCQRCYSLAFIRQGHELLAAVPGIHSEKEYLLHWETGLVYFWVQSYLSGNNKKYPYLELKYSQILDSFINEKLVPCDPRAGGVEDSLLPGEVDAAPDPGPDAVKEGWLDRGHCVINSVRELSEIYWAAPRIQYH